MCCHGFKLIKFCSNFLYFKKNYFKHIKFFENEYIYVINILRNCIAKMASSRLQLHSVKKFHNYNHEQEITNTMENNIPKKYNITKKDSFQMNKVSRGFLNF